MPSKKTVNMQLQIDTTFKNAKAAVESLNKTLSGINLDKSISTSAGAKSLDAVKAKAKEVQDVMDKIKGSDYTGVNDKYFNDLFKSLSTKVEELKNLQASLNSIKISNQLTDPSADLNDAQADLAAQKADLDLINQLLVEAKNNLAQVNYDPSLAGYQKAVQDVTDLTNEQNRLTSEIAISEQAIATLTADYQDYQRAEALAAQTQQEFGKAQSETNAVLNEANRLQESGLNSMSGLSKAQAEHTRQLKEAEQWAKQNNKAFADGEKALEAYRKEQEEAAKAALEWKQTSSTFVDDFQKAASGSDELTAALDRQITKWTSLGFIVATAKRAISDIVQTYQELDDNLSAISAVSGIATDQLWGDMPQMIDNANDLALSIDDLTNGMLLFYQQGLSTEETEIRLNAAGKMAAISQQDLATAVDQLTSTMNAFGMEGDDAANVVDVFANMAGRTATDVEELATAMARTASIAKNAGMSFEQTTAFIATMEETTRLSAETIGNSLKSIIARFQKLKTDPDSLLEDGVNANDVEKALKKADVALRDTEGNFRNIGDVIMELSAKWDTLDTNTQKYIATMAAGTQQSSNFIALVGNYSSNVDNLAYAMDSAGAAEQQFSAVSDNISSALTRLDNNWTKLKTSFSDGRNIIVDVVDVFSNFVGFLADIGPRAITAGAGIALLVAKVALLSIQQSKQIGLQNILRTLNQSSLKNEEKSAVLKEIIRAVTKKQTAATLEQTVAQKGLNKAQAANVAQNYAQAVSNNVLTISWKALSGAITKATASAALFLANPVNLALAAIVVAITAAVGAWALYTNAQKKAAKATQEEIDKLNESIAAHKEAQKTYEQDAQSLDNYIDKLKEAKDNGEDLTDIKNEIAEAFSDEQDIVIACQGSYENLISTLEETIQKKKELAQQEAYQALKEESQNRKNEKAQLEKEWNNKTKFGSKSTQAVDYYDSKGNKVNLKDYEDQRKNVWQEVSFDDGVTSGYFRKQSDSELAKDLGFKAVTTWTITDAAGNPIFSGTEEQYNAKIKELTTNFYSANDVANAMLQTGFSAESAGSKLSNQQYSQTLSLVSQFANSDFLEDGEITEKAQQEVAEVEKYYNEVIARLNVSQEDFLAFLRGDISNLSRETVDILTNQFNQDFGDIIFTNDPSTALMSSVQQNIKKGFDDAVLALTDQGVISQEQAEKLGYSAVQTLKTALDTGGTDFASSLADSFQDILNDSTSGLNSNARQGVVETLQDSLANIDWTSGNGISDFIETLDVLESKYSSLTPYLENVRQALGDNKIAVLALNEAYNQTISATEFLSTASGDGYNTFAEMAAAAENAGISLQDLNFYLDEASGKWMIAADEASNYAQQMLQADDANANAILSSAALNNSLLEEVTGMDAATMAQQGLSATEIAAAQAKLLAKQEEAKATVKALQTEADAADASVQIAQNELEQSKAVANAKIAEIKSRIAGAEAGSEEVRATSENANDIVQITEEEAEKIAQTYPAGAAALGIGKAGSGGIAVRGGATVLKQALSDAQAAQESLSSAQENLSNAQSAANQAHNKLNSAQDNLDSITDAINLLDAYSQKVYGAAKAVNDLGKASSGGGGSGGGSGGAAEASNELTDALEAQKKALQEQEKALEASKAALEEQKKALEDQKKALEDANKALQENYKLYLELIKARLNDEIDRQTTRIEAFYDAIKNSVQEEIDSLNDQLDALKKQADKLKEEADKLQDAADDQKDSLDKLYDAAQAYYDAAQDGLDNQIDSYDQLIDRNKERIDLLDEQKDAIQAQIDALDTASDSESKLLALEKARDALANARNAKTRMVLTNGGGWRLRTDKSEISNAQSNLASAQRNYQKTLLERQQKEIESQTDEIEKQNDNLENIKDTLENQKDAIDDIKDQWDKAQDALGKTTSELEEQTNLIRQFQYGDDNSRADQFNNFTSGVNQNNQAQQAASDASNRADEASNAYDQQSNEDVEGSIAEAIKKLEEQQNQADEALKQYFENQLSNNAETAEIQKQMKDLIDQMVSGQIGQLENFQQFYETINGALEQANTNASQTADYINRINASLDQYDEWSNRLDMTTDEINQRQAIMNEINNATLGSLLEGGSTFGQLQGQYEQIIRNNDEAERIQGQIDGLDSQINTVQDQIDALKEQENLISQQEKELSNSNSNKVANAAKSAGNTAASGAKSAGGTVSTAVKGSTDKLTLIAGHTGTMQNELLSHMSGTHTGVVTTIPGAIRDAASKVASAVGNITVTVDSGHKARGGLVGFSRGGVDDFTSTVAIHGTKNRPELVLNNSQSAALFKYIDSMTRIPTLSTAGSARNALSAFGTSNNTNNNGTNFTNCEFNVESNADNLDSLIQDLKQSASIRR